MARASYRVSHYRNDATVVVFDQEFNRRDSAIATFHALVGKNLNNGDCILLSRGSMTLAMKSTGERWVRLMTAFYQKEA